MLIPIGEHVLLLGRSSLGLELCHQCRRGYTFGGGFVHECLGRGRKGFRLLRVNERAGAVVLVVVNVRQIAC